MSSLWSEALEDGKSIARRQSHSSSTFTSNFRKAKLAAQDGQYSKAIKALTSDELATPSPEILQEMQNKHPQRSPPTVPQDPDLLPVFLSEPAVLKGVRSFPNTSAHGPSGLHPSHLRESIWCPSPDCAAQVLTSLTSLVNLLAASRALPSVLPHLCGAIHLASHKKSGGHRPIAVGEVLLRLTSKCLASASRLSAISSLIPLQLGVGVKGGCKAIIHTMSHLLSFTNGVGASSWIFPMLSTASAGSLCLQRSSIVPHNLQPGWNPAIPASPYFIWANIPSIAAMVCSKVTLSAC